MVPQLAGLYGPPPEPFPTEPFELVLWESIAHLADDERRAQKRVRRWI